MPHSEEAGGVRGRRVLAGEGMLVATADGFFVDAYGRHEIKAGISRVAPDHPLARRRPERFRVAWREDLPTAKLHRGNLEARMKELSGNAPRTTTPRARAPSAKPGWWIG
jgi:hypothetical protein